MTVSVQLVTWNGARYIPHLFATLRNQTYKDITLHVLDNGSHDGTPEFLAHEFATLGIPHTFDRETENKGFVGGHNALFARYRGDDFVMLLNQDMMLDPDCIEKIIAFMAEHMEAAAVAPRLMRWEPGGTERTNQIDTLGFRVYRNGRVMDYMSGHPWSDDVFSSLPHASIEYRGDRATRYVEVFGVSGALPCFRASMLRGLPGHAMLFDADFFSYKEDVDLAFRLRRMGWKAYMLPDAVAYHDRSSAAPKDGSDKRAREHWRHKSELIRNYSYRNHGFLLLKHGRFAFPVLWFELKKFVYLLLKDRAVMWFAMQNFGLYKKMLQKRALLARAEIIHPVELRRWMI